MGGWQHLPCSLASPFPKFRALSPVSPGWDLSPTSGAALGPQAWPHH